MKFPKSACIEMLYLELPFFDRFAAAKRDGFDYVEFWDWRDKDLARVKASAQDAGIGVSGFNGGGDFSLIDPAHKAGCLDELKRSMDAALLLGAPAVTILSNALGADGRAANAYPELSDTVKRCAMFSALTECARLAGDSGVRVHLEPLNTRIDHQGTYLTTTAMAAEMTRLVGSPMLRVLYDVYHMQLSEGALCDTLARHIDQIGHVHVADVPGRHEPGTGEIRYARVFEQLEKCGYRGIVCYELTPSTTTEAAVRAIMRD